MRRLGADVALIDVAHLPALAERLARRTGVRHESPQAIILRAGMPVWHASHGGITAAAVGRALAQAAEPPECLAT